MSLSSYFRSHSTAVIFFILFTTTCSVLFSQEESSGLKPIPDWAETQIRETLTRFEEWKGNDTVVVFPLTTDLHSETTRQGIIHSDPSETDWSDSKNHVYIAQQAAVSFKADLLADLGDIGIDRYDDYVPSTPEDLYWRIAAQLRLYQDFTAVPVLFMIGNHDHGNDAVSFSSRLFGETFNLMTIRRGTPLVTGPNFDYGYYDLSDKKTRIFFLNSSDDAYYGYSAAQLQFLADHLKMEPGWTALICQHFCVDRSVGLWKSASHIKAYRGEIWTAILISFLENGKGESDGIVWDFTQNKDCRFAGAIAGDSHYDNQGTANGINSIISQGFGDVLDENTPEGAVHTRFDLTHETLIDVAALKPEKRELKLFRIGAGGAERDRSFSF